MAYPYPLSYATLSTVPRPSFFATARYIYSRDGLAGFYRGLGPCILRAFPVNACAFFVYEGTMRLLGAEKVFTPFSNVLSSIQINLHPCPDPPLICSTQYAPLVEALTPDAISYPTVQRHRRELFVSYFRVWNTKWRKGMIQIKK